MIQTNTCEVSWGSGWRFLYNYNKLMASKRADETWLTNLKGTISMVPRERGVVDLVFLTHGWHNCSSRFLASFTAAISSGVCAKCKSLSTDVKDAFSSWNLERASAAFNGAISR